MNSNTVPQWMLERYQLGELPPQQMQELQRQIAADPVLQERLCALEKSDQEILASMPPAWMANHVLRRHHAATAEREKMGNRWERFSPFPHPVGALVFLVFLLPALWLLRDNSQPWFRDDGTRAKGEFAGIELWRKVGEDAQRLESGASARKRDVVQIRYWVRIPVYGAIFSLDGRGTVTQHLPERGAPVPRLEPGRPVALGFSYELDDAPRYERFYLITAEQSFVAEEVRTAVQALYRPEELPDSLRLTGKHVVYFTLGKESQ